jgi:hypothetical protein
VSQLSVTKQKMYDQQQHTPGMTKDLTDIQMFEALTQAIFQL